MQSVSCQPIVSAARLLNLNVRPDRRDLLDLPDSPDNPAIKEGLVNPVNPALLVHLAQLKKPPASNAPLDHLANLEDRDRLDHQEGTDNPEHPHMVADKDHLDHPDLLDLQDNLVSQEDLANLALPDSLEHLEKPSQGRKDRLARLAHPANLALQMVSLDALEDKDLLAHKDLPVTPDNPALLGSPDNLVALDLLAVTRSTALAHLVAAAEVRILLRPLLLLQLPKRTRLQLPLKCLSQRPLRRQPPVVERRQWAAKLPQPEATVARPQ